MTLLSKISFALFAIMASAWLGTDFFQTLGASDVHLALITGAFLVIAASSYWKNKQDREKAIAALPVFTGIISPGKGKIPKDVPQIGNDQRILLLGDALCVTTSGSENSILSKGGVPFLSIGINDAGLMTLSATIVDSSGNRVVKIIENEFQASEEFSFFPKQPNEHSLIVRDSDGVEVLDIRFINPKAIRIIGRFQLSQSSEPVIISSDQGIRWPGGGGMRDLTLNIKEGGLIDFDNVF